MAACPGRSTGCFRNNNPDNKFLCNICADTLQNLPRGANPERPNDSGTDAIIQVATMFDAGDTAGYQSILASWLPILRTV
jgi:hypothetical protein